MNLLTHNEAFAYLQGGGLPENFAERLPNLLEFDDCSNCDGVRCMHFVLRDWWAPDFDDCDGFCCPFCGEWARTMAAAEAVCSFLRAAARPRYGPEMVENAAFAAIGLS